MNLFRYVGNAYTVTTDPSGYVWPTGHHWIPNEVISSPDIRSKLTEVAVDISAGHYSGPTTPKHGGSNSTINGVAHDKYNKAVEDELNEYMKEKGITSRRKMSGDEMNEFAERIRDGKDLKTKGAVDIKKFNEGVKAQQKGTGLKPPPTDIDKVQKRGRQYRQSAGRFLSFAGISTVLAVFASGTAMAGTLDNISQSPHYKNAIQAALRGDISAVEKNLIGGGDSHAFDESHLFGTIARSMLQSNPLTSQSLLQETHTTMVKYFSSLARQRDALECKK